MKSLCFGRNKGTEKCRDLMLVDVQKCQFTQRDIQEGRKGYQEAVRRTQERLNKMGVCHD